MSKTRRRIVSTVAHAARTLLFPPRCVGCGDLLPPFGDGEPVFCPLCRTAWETALAEAARQSAQDAARGLVYLAFYHSGRADGVAERLIYHLKHRGDPRTFGFVAKRLAPRITRAAACLPMRAPESAEEKPLLFTYPPRRRSAVSEDGFDQAARLAKALAEVCGGECVTLIRRTHRKSDEQKQLEAHERAENAARSYVPVQAADDFVRDRVVVLCDDLYTTGATLNRCAELIVGAGARSVILVTVERTRGDSSCES